MRPAPLLPLLGSAIQIAIEPRFVIEILIVAAAIVVVLLLAARKR